MKNLALGLAFFLAFITGIAGTLYITFFFGMLGLTFFPMALIAVILSVVCFFLLNKAYRSFRANENYNYVGLMLVQLLLVGGIYAVLANLAKNIR